MRITIEKLENKAVDSPSKLEVLPGKCKECNNPLIVTADRTKCCSSCGLVVGNGYSWFGGSGTVGWSGVIDNIERILENRVSKRGWG